MEQNNPPQEGTPPLHLVHPHTYASSHGLHGLELHQVQPDGSFRLIGPETLRFELLTYALNIGVEMLETEKGRRALTTLGTALYSAWRIREKKRPLGHAMTMSTRVNRFLTAIRNGFPMILVLHLGNHIFAQTTREDLENPNWEQYEPRRAAHIEFNHDIFEDMMQARETKDGDRRMSDKYNNLLLAFVVTTVHELAHVFVGYMGENGAKGPGTTHTPGAITFLDYDTLLSDSEDSSPCSEYVPSIPDDSWESLGEAGRYLENLLFGGAIENLPLRDEDEGFDSKINYLVGPDKIAREIHPLYIYDSIGDDLEVRDFNFPWSTIGPGRIPTRFIRKPKSSSEASEDESA